MPKLPTDPHEMERIVVGLAAAAFKNARDMLTSAQAVLDAQIWPTAFSMAALALEEVGKAVLCMTMLGKSPEARDEFRPQVHKAFTDHKTKAACAHLVLAVVAEEAPATLEQMLDEVIQSAHETNAVKFRGLYVDYTDTGALLMPDVDEARARWMVSTVTTALAESRPAEEAVADPDAYLAFLRQWQGSVDFEALEAYIEAAPEDFMADVRALVRDDVPPPTIFLGSALAQQITTVDGLHVAAGEEAPPIEA
ncbi:AbiV family abortive infection protein (plasmid) [Streptomyces sp. NBC_01724]|uniref:AbiV family abortive infection protein n=1 Tax=Streptomyces sp. NBC_01724 TaxID=2975922 RepID=UPI002E2F08A6|nr:AbiV family abortive infection protein [Streptomyces sp. NBC_01724]